MHQVFRRILGAVLLILGIFSLLVPFLPGLLFILAGLVLLGNHSACSHLARLRRQLSKLLGHRAARFMLPSGGKAAPIWGKKNI